MKEVQLRDAKATLSALVEDAAQGTRRRHHPPRQAPGGDPRDR